MERHTLTTQERRRGGYSTAAKRAPAGEHCPHCGKSSNDYEAFLQWTGHLGFCSFAQKYTDGDKRRAGDLLSRWGLATIDPFPQNGAWQRKAPLPLSA